MPPSRLGHQHLYLLHGYLGLPDSEFQMISGSDQPFCSAHSRASLYFTMGYPFPPKLPLLMGYLDPNLIRGSLSPPEFATQMTSQFIQPFLLAHECDRQTDLTNWSVTVGCIYIRSTALQPINRYLSFNWPKIVV